MVSIDHGNTIAQLNLGPQDTGESAGPGALGQSDFLEIMLAQLQNQDPLNPMDGANFLGQLAQFGTVDGVQSLDRSFNELSRSLTSTQALQASSLVGRSVLVESAIGKFDGSVLRGAVDVPSDVGSVVLEVKDSSGRLVQSKPMAVQGDGRTAFEWDGSTIAGGRAAAGVYEVSVSGQTGGQNTALKTYVRANVESVTLGQGSGGIVLNLAGLGVRALNNVEEIL